MEKILIAIIAYNEEKNIEKTIKDLRDNNFGYDIVVVDNASKDKTVEIAKSLGVDVISHCVNTGGGMGTVTTYLTYAYSRGYDCVCQFDGDGQHIAKEIKKITNPIINNEADYVIGTRFINKKGFQSTFLRRIGIRLFSIILSKIIKQKLTDSTSGFKAYGKNVMNTFAKKVRIQLNDINQMLLLAYFNGARIKEIPIVMKEREAGVSEFNIINSIMFPIKGVVNIIGTYLQKNK